jgi:O-antigen ligase
MGVTITLSRGAVLVFVFVLGALFYLGRLSRQTVVAVAIILGSLVAALVLFLWPIFSDVVGNLGNLDRLLLIMNPSDQADFSQNERVYLAEYGWAQFLDSPSFGNGIGSTETWIHRSSTHNQYLQFMSDFGVTGMFVMPGLALALCIGRTRHDIVPLGIAGCVLLWSFVSHNVLTEYYWLIAIALAAAMPSAAAGPITGRGLGKSSQVPSPGAAT